MTKPKLLGMKKLATELGDLAANPRIRNRIVAAAAVRFIADHGVFDPRKVHTNLVRAAGL
jgi:hypothetical protein